MKKAITDIGKFLEGVATEEEATETQEEVSAMDRAMQAAIEEHAVAPKSSDADPEMPTGTRTSGEKVVFGRRTTKTA